MSTNCSLLLLNGQYDTAGTVVTILFSVMLGQSGNEYLNIITPDAFPSVTMQTLIVLQIKVTFQKRKQLLRNIT